MQTATDSVKPPTAAKASARGDKLFRWLTIISALLIPALMGGIFLSLLQQSWPALQRFGFGFLTSQQWNPVTENFGAVSSIYGTLVSTFIAMLIAVPLSIALALFLVELAPPRVSRVVGTVIELLAAIPSIIYGMWGMFVFAPFMANYIQPTLGEDPGLAAAVSRPAHGHRHAYRRHHPGLHGPALYLRHHPGRLQPGAPGGEGGRLRHGRHHLGSDL